MPHDTAADQAQVTVTVTRPARVHPDVLYPDGQRPSGQNDRETLEPEYFRDLNLDQVVTAITAGKADYHLSPLYWSPLRDLDSLSYRHEVFQDVEREEIGSLIRDFARRRLVFQFGYRTKEMRNDNHGQQHHYRTRFFLNAAQEYCQAVLDLTNGLETAAPASRGLDTLAIYLHDYVNSERFIALSTETARLEAELTDVQYVIVVRGDRITVAGYDGESDYGDHVATTFQRFRQQPDDIPGVDKPEVRSRSQDAYAGTGVLDLVAQLYPILFADVEAFCAQHLDYLDPVIARFEHDIQFYLAYLDHLAPLRAANLSFSYPRLSDSDKTEQALHTFDLALAHKLEQSRHPSRSQRRAGSVRVESARTETGPQVVVNDITLTGEERILVISGPNNGGKTTIARTIGQLHYLARLGCPVPGRDTQLFVCDQIFTHFERAEDSTTMTGRLQTELDRLRDDFAVATPASLIILNEIFNSTTADDALLLSRRILERVSALDALCVCVTFLDELATLNNKTVSMVSTVDPDDPATRTHQVIRNPADGRAYAQAIADKYGLGFHHLVKVLSR